MAAPNLSTISGFVEGVVTSDDGWGAWAEIRVEASEPVAGEADWGRGIVGSTVRFFVPPPLVGSARVGAPFRGRASFRGGPPGAWSLVPS